MKNIAVFTLQIALYICLATGISKAKPQKECVKVEVISALDDQSNPLEVDLHIKEHKFYPETLKLPSGRKIRIKVHNHDATIEEFESFDLKREKIIRGNSSAVVILAPLKPGIYKFFGEFHEETAQGEIIVEEVN